jgi:phage tail-like protein
MSLFQRSIDLGTNTGRRDPFTSYQFALEIDGIQSATFDKLEGGDITIAVVTHDIVYETGESTTLFIPGTTSFGEFTLTSFVTANMEVINWLSLASSGDIVQARRNGSIILRGHENGVYTDLARWDFDNAWPSKISGFSLARDRSQLAELRLTIHAETITRVDP